MNGQSNASVYVIAEYRMELFLIFHLSVVLFQQISTHTDTATDTHKHTELVRITCMVGPLKNLPSWFFCPVAQAPWVVRPSCNASEGRKVGGRRAAGTDGSFQSLPQLFSLPFIPASELFQHLAQILLKGLVSYWLEPGSSLSAGQ